MHLGELAATSADKAAYVIAETGVTTTFKQLDDLSMRASHLFRQLGLNRGDHVAILLENHPALLQICFRGAAIWPLFLRLFPTDYRTKRSKYIVNDCQAKVFITSKSQQNLVGKLNRGSLPQLYG